MTTLLLLLVLFTTQKLAVAMDTHITNLDLNQCMNAQSNGVLPWVLEGSGVILNREAFSVKVFTCLAKKDDAYRKYNTHVESMCQRHLRLLRSELTRCKRMVVEDMGWL